MPEQVLCGPTVAGPLPCRGEDAVYQGESGQVRLIKLVQSDRRRVGVTCDAQWRYLADADHTVAIVFETFLPSEGIKGGGER